MLLYGRSVMNELTVFQRALADEEKFRVFLSYSHEYVELVVTLDRILRENGFDPMWDRHFASGHGFRDQIRNFIAHAHVFVPVLTPKADERKWVHQEIGYRIVGARDSKKSELVLALDGTPFLMNGPVGPTARRSRTDCDCNENRAADLHSVARLRLRRDLFHPYDILDGSSSVRVTVPTPTLS